MQLKTFSSLTKFSTDKVATDILPDSYIIVSTKHFDI
jgi:hypothetical protein